VGNTVDRAKREAAILGCVAHPNVITLHECIDPEDSEKL
jgi:hypothetical protein